MTQRSDGLYTTIGTDPWRPKWYIKRRGLNWLRWGLCPWCYSSPPNTACDICLGSYDYGKHRMTDATRARWKQRFLMKLEEK